MQRHGALTISLLAAIPAGVAMMAAAALPLQAAGIAASGADAGSSPGATLAACAIILLGMALLVRGLAPAARRAGARAA